MGLKKEIARLNHELSVNTVAIRTSVHHRLWHKFRDFAAQRSNIKDMLIEAQAELIKAYEAERGSITPQGKPVLKVINGGKAG